MISRQKTYSGTVKKLNNLWLSFVIQESALEFSRRIDKGIYMATFKDPIKCFAPLEVVERLLEIRADLGYTEAVYLNSSLELADFLDAFGFDVYAFSFSMKDEKINYCDYRSSIVPGGDALHLSLTAH